VRPTQLVRRLLTYWVTLVQEPHVNEVAAAESFAVTQVQVFGKFCDERRSILSTGFAALLEFDDVLSDPPVGFNQLGVDGLYGSDLTLPVGVGNLFQQLAVTVGGGQFHTTPIFFRCSSTRAAQVALSHRTRWFPLVGACSLMRCCGGL